MVIKFLCMHIKIINSYVALNPIDIRITAIESTFLGKEGSLSLKVVWNRLFSKKIVSRNPSTLNEKDRDFYFFFMENILYNIHIISEVTVVTYQYNTNWL